MGGLRKIGGYGVQEIELRSFVCGLVHCISLLRSTGYSLLYGVVVLEAAF